MNLTAALEDADWLATIHRARFGIFSGPSGFTVEKITRANESRALEVVNGKGR